jgi:hypothetical protein
MEGWSRCLWGIGPYIAGGGKWPGIDNLRETLSRGVNPEDPAYWGDCGDRDQRLVEMAAIAFSLILAPKVFWEPLDRKTKKNLHRWLSFIETCDMPSSNWRYFRLIVQAAFRSLGLPVNEELEKESFELMETYYRGEGWYQDGPMGGFDLYNPWGFHYYSLILAATEKFQDENAIIHRFAGRFRERARVFAPSYAAWFYRDGERIPHGRSLTYRFAEAGFFAACAFDGLEALSWSAMKGLFMRNLRRWFSRPILDAGGILSVGYGYSNIIMADAYNSPGSPYWALKAYLVLALKEDHPFWLADEGLLPFAEPEKGRCFNVTHKTPGFIISNSAADAQLLTAGFRNVSDANHTAQKYCKFAYSARFGFCVTHSNFNIEKTGCDSMLLFSEGDSYWRDRRLVSDVETGENWVKSTWQPWSDVSVITTLVRLGDWHVRVHRIETARTLLSVEGGFSIPRYESARDKFMPLDNSAQGAGALLLYPWAASRIEALENTFPEEIQHISRKGAIVNPSPNLNLLYPLVAIPVLEGGLEAGITFWASAVWAGDGSDKDAEAGSKAPTIITVKQGSVYRFAISNGKDSVAVELPV